jgi:C_GCAxxG_C_C family probable redox protein
LQDTFDLKDEALLKASGALTGGIGGLADTCGSMIGATLVLGSVCGKGRQDADDEKGLKKLFESVGRAADFFNWFKEEHGTVNCHDIVTNYGNGTFYDFGIPEESKLAREAGVFDKCVEHVQKNVTKAAEILWDEFYKGD